MKNNIFITGLGIFLLWWITSAPAIVVPNLYSAQLPIENLSAQARQQVFSQALQQVLIKITGNTAIATLPAIQSSLGNASSLVDSYSYSTQQQLSLKENFNPQAIQQILRNAKQALWDKNRPSILVWLDFNSNILINNNYDPVVLALKDNARRMGLPIILPTSNDLSANDIEQLNIAAINHASQYYHSNIILLGYLTQTLTNNYQGSWTLLLNDNIVHWNIVAVNPEQMLTKIIDNIAGTLAARLAILNDSALLKQLTILVTGVTGLAGYANITKYLRSLNTVSNVNLLAAGPDYVKLQVTSIGGLQQLVNAINMGNNLVSDSAGNPDSSVDLIYHWVANKS